jgi:prepilin-type processing-associated H-X9-DG protein
MNETGIPYYIRARGNYRGCVGPGDVYGKAVSTGPPGAGVFRVVPGQCDQTKIAPHRTKLRNIRDGSSNTIMFAEALIPNMDNWTTIGDITLANMGGSLFSTFLTPNSSSADKVWGPCPGPQGDGGYKAPCVSLGGPNRPPGSSTNNQAGAFAAARSRHLGGVNMALADGAVRFVGNEISQSIWWALGTASSGETISEIW